MARDCAIDADAPGGTAEERVIVQCNSCCQSSELKVSALRCLSSVGLSVCLRALRCHEITRLSQPASRAAAKKPRKPVRTLGGSA